jgi:hypothetical protein
MLAACAGIAIPLRTFIFERTGGEAAPAAVASRAPEPAKASLPTTAPRSDRADVARTAAVAPPAPQKVEAALPPVEAPAPFLIGETQRPAPSAIAPAPAPIATAQAPASPVPATEPSAPPAVTLVPLAPPRAKPEPPSTRVAAVGDVNVGPSRPPAPGAGRASFDATRLLARAEELIQAGDISAARLMLERAMQSGSAAATFRLAETFDPQVLAQWQTRGIKGDVERARELYARALANGIADSKLRIEALR